MKQPSAAGARRARRPRTWAAERAAIVAYLRHIGAIDLANVIAHGRHHAK